jgi:hypothetical protein
MAYKVELAQRTALAFEVAKMIPAGVTYRELVNRGYDFAQLPDGVLLHLFVIGKAFSLSLDDKTTMDIGMKAEQMTQQEVLDLISQVDVIQSRLSDILTEVPDEEAHEEIDAGRGAEVSYGKPTLH